MKLFPVTTNVSLLSSDTKSLDKMNVGDIDYTNELKVKDLPE